MLLSSCGDAARQPAKPVTMTDQRLIAGLRACGIDPADATQANELENGKRVGYLVFGVDPPYPAPKMRCLAALLLQAHYAVRQSGEPFESAYRDAWNAEFPIFTRELALAWLREHRPGESPPQFMPGDAPRDFAQVLEKFCGAGPGSMTVERRTFLIADTEDVSRIDCLFHAGLGANLERQGFSVHAPSYE